MDAKAKAEEWIGAIQPHRMNEHETEGVAIMSDLITELTTLREENERLKAEQKPNEITITLDQAEELVMFFGGDRESTMTIRIAEEGHSGPGLYVYCTDYPEEGSVTLGLIGGHAGQEAAEAAKG